MFSSRFAYGYVYFTLYVEFSYCKVVKKINDKIMVLMATFKYP